MRTLRLLLPLLMLIPATSVLGQKYAYVDTEYILSHLPEYAEAQKELNSLAKEWLDEIEEKYEASNQLETAYRAERVLLTSEMRRKREDEISAKRTEATDMQRAKFGVEGELFQKRQELIQPVQEQIFQVLKDLSSSRGYMVIFDKAKDSNMLYTNPKYDISDRVIKELGYTPGETIEGEESEADGEKGKSLQDRMNDTLDKGKDKVNDRREQVTNRVNSGIKGGGRPKQ
ncbi:MAG: OmpH family outer membrane protein [Flavobacteriales bacterium]|jgi:outer membrane protein|nr:OmpH family outer membrane protein [Flavobacteriales bacterium]